MARVKQIRLARGLTQEQFAECANLDPKYYQHAEAGRKPNPELETLLKLSNACGLKLCDLLNFDIEPEIASEASTTAAPRKKSPRAAKPRAASSK